jgi:hypothetical protein
MLTHSTCKAALAALLLSTCALQAARADIVTFVGDTTGAPVYKRLDLFDGLPSDTATAVNYRAYNVSVSQTADDYSFVTSCTYDCFVFLYEGAFNPATPTQNVIGASDDLLNYNTAGFAGELTAGTNYVFVVTAYENGAAGPFSTTIAGTGDITVGAVPEPGTYLMLGAGLVAGGLRQRRRAKTVNGANSAPEN